MPTSLGRSPAGSPQKHPSPLRRSLRDIVIAQSFGALLPQVLILGGVLSLFILHFGGSKLQMGAIFTVNFLAQAIRVPVAGYVDRQRRKRIVLVWHAAAWLSFLAMFLVLPVDRAWGHHAAAWTIIGVFLAQRVFTNVGGAAWMPFLSDLLPRAIRGRFIGRMQGVLRAASALAVIAAGWYLGRDPDVWKYYTLFGVLLGFSLVRILLLLRLPDPAPARAKPERLRRRLRRPLADRGFLRFLTFFLGLTAARMMVLPYAVPFVKTDLHFPESLTVYAAAGLAVGSILTFSVWGRLTDRLGNRFVFMTSILITSGAFLVLAAVPVFEGTLGLSLPLAAGAFVLAGAGNAGIITGHIVRLMHASPEAHRGAYMGLFVTIKGLVGGGVSFLAGLMLDGLPVSIEVVGTAVLTTRLLFAGAAFVILATLVPLRRLQTVSEPDLSEAVRRFRSVLPLFAGHRTSYSGDQRQAAD